ncbi:hypothetical protein Tco_1430331 [Tanacetum coccineum]
METSTIGHPMVVCVILAWCSGGYDGGVVAVMIDGVMVVLIGVGGENNICFSPLLIRVLDHGTEVLSPAEDEYTGEKGVLVADDGDVVEDDAPVSFPTKRFSKKRVDYDDEVVDDDNRFKLRNGRESNLAMFDTKLMGLIEA